MVFGSGKGGVMGRGFGRCEFQSPWNWGRNSQKPNDLVRVSFGSYELLFLWNSYFLHLNFQHKNPWRSLWHHTFSMVTSTHIGVDSWGLGGLVGTLFSDRPRAFWPRTKYLTPQSSVLTHYIWPSEASPLFWLESSALRVNVCVCLAVSQVRPHAFTICHEIRNQRTWYQGKATHV